MSIESNLENLVASSMRIERLLEQLISETQEVKNEPTPYVPAPAPVVHAAPPVVESAPVPAPAAAPVSATPAPFKDSKGLMDYCMGKYRELGPIKGAQIQQILLELGVNNLNALPAEHFGTFFLKVEAL